MQNRERAYARAGFTANLFGTYLRRPTRLTLFNEIHNLTLF